jgi:hypothetical protein
MKRRPESRERRDKPPMPAEILELVDLLAEIEAHRAVAEAAAGRAKVPPPE